MDDLTYPRDLLLTACHCHWPPNWFKIIIPEYLRPAEIENFITILKNIFRSKIIRWFKKSSFYLLKMKSWQRKWQILGTEVVFFSITLSILKIKVLRTSLIFFNVLSFWNIPVNRTRHYSENVKKILRLKAVTKSGVFRYFNLKIKIF